MVPPESWDSLAKQFRFSHGFRESMGALRKRHGCFGPSFNVTHGACLLTRGAAGAAFSLRARQEQDNIRAAHDRRARASACKLRRDPTLHAYSYRLVIIVIHLKRGNGPNMPPYRLHRGSHMTLYYCPFCSSTLVASELRNLGEGDTGGFAYAQEFVCPSCSMAMHYMLIDKIGTIREWWRLHAAPSAEATPRRSNFAFPIYGCPHCGRGDLRPAVPVGDYPAPRKPPLFRGIDDKRSRDIAYVCDSCGAQYERLEEGTFDALTVQAWRSRLVHVSAENAQTIAELMPEAAQPRPKADL